MKRKVNVIFTGAVFNVHVYVGGYEISISKGLSDDWEGQEDIDIAGDQVRIDMKFIAPSFTDWKLILKFDNKEVINESGTSDTVRTSFTKSIQLD